MGLFGQCGELASKLLFCQFGGGVAVERFRKCDGVQTAEVKA